MAALFLAIRFHMTTNQLLLDGSMLLLRLGQVDLEGLLIGLLGPGLGLVSSHGELD